MRTVPRGPDFTKLAIVFEGGIVLLALLLAWAIGFSLMDNIRLSWTAVWWAAIETIPLLIFAWWSLHSRWPPIARLCGTVREWVVPMFAGCSVYGLAGISLLAGVGEEALFRGVLFHVFAQGLGTWGALTATSVLFGMAHFVTSGYAVLAGVIGGYLGALALFHQNLAVPMLVHALYDFLALTYMVSQHRGEAAEPVTA